MAANPSEHSSSPPHTPPVQRLRLYGPSLITLAVLLPFFAYYLQETKAAQGYLNDRAFRILDVTSRQFGSEITGIGNTIGAAYLLPGQLALRKRDQAIARRTKWLYEKGASLPEIAEAEVQSYVNTYVLDGVSSVKVEQVVPKNPKESVAAVTKPKVPESSPLISICCRFGNSSLRIQFLEEKTVNVSGADLQVRMDIKLDPDRMLERTFGARGDLFETVFVANRNGEVLAETSSSRLTVKDVEAILANRRVRGVVEGGQNGQKEEPSAEGSDQGKLPRQVWGADQRFDVQVSGTSYVLFVAPAPFVLNDETGKETPIAFYGLTRKDEIDAQARRIPSLSLPLIFFTIIVGMAFLWPALKLYTMSDRDRLTKFSVTAMLAITVTAAALFGALYLSYGFFLDMSDRSDGQIVQLSEQIRSHFAREVSDALQASESILEKLRASSDSLPNKWPPDTYYLLSQTGPSLVEPYPFLAHVMLLGAKPKGDQAAARDPADEPSELRQIVKFSATPIPTPLISLPPSRFDFIGRLRHGRYAIQDSIPFVLEALISPSTGEFLPTMIFSPKASENSEFRILTTTQLPSLVRALLPQGFSFAVVDSTGQVLFHSDPSRNLHENFFGETDDPGELKLALQRMERKHLLLRYGGRSIRAFVQPMGCEESERSAHCIHDLGMGLIVFQGVDEQKERLSTVGSNFLVYLLALPTLIAVFALVATSLKNAVWPAAALASARRRIWPRESEKTLYLLKGIWGIACFGIAVLIAIVFRIFADHFVAFPLLLPSILSVMLTGCVAGALLLRRQSALIKRLREHKCIVRCENRIPLSAAYSLRIFAVWLAISGLLSLLIYQMAVSSAQLRFESDSYRSLAAAVQNRKLRYLNDFHTSFEDTSYNTQGSWQQFCQNRINKAYDSYDWRINKQPGILSLLHDAPMLNGFTFFDQSRNFRALPDPCLWTAAAPASGTDSLDREPIWSALPAPSFGSTAAFYLPCLLLLIGMFLWVHRIVRRLFILDFREPDPLPQLDEEACGRRMQAAIDCESGPLDRILIFAHPRSGTGVALERIVKKLKEHSPSAGCEIIDFGKTAAGEISDHSEVLTAATNSKIVILDNFEVRLLESADRIKRLSFLESLAYSHKPSVYVLTSIDPLLLLESLVREQPSERLQSELNRWTRLIGNFERFVFEDHSKMAVVQKTVEALKKRCADDGIEPAAAGEYAEILTAELQPTLFLRACACLIKVEKLDLTGTRHFERSLVTQVRNLTDGYYRVLWLNCTSDERLALYQLAKDNWLNPLNEVSISHLLQKQLIRRDGAYRLMNVSFRSFVLEAVTTRELTMWQKQQNLSLWPALRMALGLALFLVVLFASYFWRDIFDVYLSYLVAIAGGAAALFRIVAQFFTKDGSKLAVFTAGESSKPGGAAA